MKPLGNSNLVKFFLKNSPHSIVKRFNSKFINTPIPLNSVISNRGYVNKFLVDIGCQDLVFPYENFNTSQKFSTKTTQRTFTSKKTSVLELIKKTQRSNISSITLVEAQQKIQMLSSQQSQQSIKQLMYLQKQLKKNEDKMPQRLLELNQSLIVSIGNKIYEGVERMRQMKQSKNELGKILLLNAARKNREIGDVKSARSQYEQIYQDENMEQAVRLQALQYLCIKSIEKGDKSYLEQMQKSLQQKGLQKHKQFIKKYMQTANKKDSF